MVEFILNLIVREICVRVCLYRSKKMILKKGECGVFISFLPSICQHIHAGAEWMPHTKQLL